MIDTVVFDLDDTLCEYRRSGSDLLTTAFDRAGVEPFFAIEDYYAIFDVHIPESDTVDENRRRCFESLAHETGRDPAVGRAVANAYAAERDHRNVRLLPGAEEVLERLSPDHRLGIVTNGSPDAQSQKLDVLGLADVFETVVHAGYDTPAAKPHPEPFHRALDALDSSPERTVHVGNSIESDVAGAHAAGLRSVWVPVRPVDGRPDPEPHYTLESLHDLHPGLF